MSVYDKLNTRASKTSHHWTIENKIYHIGMQVDFPRHITVFFKLDFYS